MDMEAAIGGETRTQRLHRWMGVVGFTFLACYVALQSRPAFFDEVPYLDLARRLGQSPSLAHWLREEYVWPAGPLHPLMHFLLSGGGAGCPAPWLRLPNLAGLAFIAWAVARLVADGRPGTGSRSLTMLLTIPMMWTVSGLALTEVPAMAALTGALLAAERCRQEEPAAPTGTWLLLGLCLSAALCGRQTYLLLAPLVLTWAADLRWPGWKPVVAAVVGLMPFAVLVVLWGGLTSPAAAMAPGFLPQHGLYALGYLGAVALWVAPRLWLAHWRPAMLVGLVAVAGNAATDFLRFTTLTSAQTLPVIGGLIGALELIASHGAVAAGASFLAVAAGEWYERRDSRFALCALALLALCVASAGIPHQFSSRYIAMGAPFFILMLWSHVDWGVAGAVRSFLGMAAGFASLHSYFVRAT